MVMIKCLDLKRRKRKINGSRQRYKWQEPFVSVIKTLSECDHI